MLTISLRSDIYKIKANKGENEDFLSVFGVRR